MADVAADSSPPRAGAGAGAGDDSGRPADASATALSLTKPGKAGSVDVHHPKTWTHAGFGTRVVHAGQDPDPVTGAVAVPISLATTFAQPSPGVPMGMHSHLSHYHGFEYQRTNNPTRSAFEKAVASAEGAAHCLAFASGMSAITAVIHLLAHGDHVISIDDVYGGSRRYFTRVVTPTYGIHFSFVDLGDVEAVEAAVTPATKLLWVESPSNPTLRVVDIAALAALARKRRLILVVDNTFMSPYFQQPLKLGATVSLNSVSKYIGGHSDVLGGALATNDDDIHTRLRFIQNSVGGVMSPFDAYMASRGLKTLHVRMDRHQSNALAVARLLEAHPAVTQVRYPGLASHPGHHVAAAQTSGHGGVVAFWLAGGVEQARVFLETVHVFTLAESLGAVESLVESPAIMTHASVPAAERAKLGISASLIRLSVGIEDVADLCADLAAALAAVAASLAAP